MNRGHAEPSRKIDPYPTTVLWLTLMWAQTMNRMKVKQKTKPSCKSQFKQVPILKGELVNYKNEVPLRDCL